MLKDIEQFINKLDNDLNCFEVDLRGKTRLTIYLLISLQRSM